MAAANHFNAERAASILVEAAYKGDKRTASAWGMTTRTLRNWRTRLQADAEFSQLFQHKREQAEKNWAADAPLTIRAAMDFLKHAAQTGKPTPEMVHAVAGAMKLVADATLTKQVLDARLAERNRPQNGSHREMAAAGDFSAN